jgi:hypothetical protein
VAVDELRRTWTRRRYGSNDQPAVAQRAHRRVLQLKLLLATLLVAVLTNLGDPRDYFGRTADPDGGPPLLLKFAFVLVLALAFVGVFMRRRGLAGTVAAGLLTVFVIDLYALAPAYRVTLLVQQGWLVLTAAYLWAKAAAKPYWQWQSPFQNPERPDPPNLMPLPDWNHPPTQW